MSSFIIKLVVFFKYSYLFFFVDKAEANKWLVAIRKQQSLND